MSAAVALTDRHIVVVHFSVDAAEQSAAAQKIGDYVASFLSQQPGFIASRLHLSNAGTGLLHYAEWESEADFQAAGALAREHPDLPALRAYQPSGVGYQVVRTFGETA